MGRTSFQPGSAHVHNVSRCVSSWKSDPSIAFIGVLLLKIFFIFDAVLIDLD